MFNLRITLFIFFTIVNCLSLRDSIGSEPVFLKKEKNIYHLGFTLGILEDKTKKLTFDQIISPENENKFITSRTKIPSFGMSSSTFWIKFDLENESHPSNEWLISFQQVWCDYVDFYQKVNGKWEITKTGDRRSFNTRPINNRNFVFKIRPGKKSTYYMRIQSNDGIQIPLKLYSASSFSEEESFTMLGFGLFYGIMVVMIIYNLFVFFSTKSVSYLYYVFYIASYTLLNMATNGLGFQFLYPEWIWFQNEGFLCRSSLVGAALIFFTINYLGVDNSTPRIHKTFKFFAYGALFFILSSVFPFYKFLLGPFYLFLVSGFSFFIFVGIYKLKMNYRPARYYLLAFIFLTGGGILQIAQMNGFLPPWFIFLNAFQIGGVFEVVLLSLGLADIINTLLEENVKANQQLEEINLNLEEKVKQRTKDLSEALGDISNLLNNMRQAVFTVSRGGIIQNPVSEFSSQIFESDIAGENIFENIYNCIDPKSEMYSTIQFSLGIIFGADDLQWEMVKDHFPNRLVVNTPTSGSQKILKVASNPIFDKDGLLERVMFVVEDVTEIEKLEQEMEDQKKASMKNLQILQELASNKKDDLSEFFSSVNKMTLDCLFLSKKIRAQIEKSDEITDFGLLFRQLHTIKGNARVYGLSLISSSAHHSENVLSEFFESEKKNNIEYDHVNKLVQELYGLQGQINEYIKAAKDVFALEFKEDLKFKEKLHDLAKGLEYWVSRLPSSLITDSSESNSDSDVIKSIKNNKEREQSIEELVNISHSMKGLARGMDERELSQLIHLLENGINYLKEDEGYSFEQYKEYFIDPLNEIRRKLKDIYLKSSQYRSLDINLDSWVQIIRDIFNLSKKVNNLNKEELKNLTQEIYNIHAKSINISLDFFSSMFRYMYDLVEEDEIQINKIKGCLKEIWKFIIVFIQLDFYKNLPLSESIKLLSALKEKQDDFKFNEQIVFTSLLSDLKKHDASSDLFFNVVSDILDEEKSLVIDKFCSQVNFKDFINELYYEMFRSETDDAFEKVRRLFSLDTTPFINELDNYINGKNFTWHFYTKSMDILKLMKNFIDIEDFKESDLKPQIYEVMVDNFNSLKDKINILPGITEDDKLNVINPIFDKLLYLPVKYSFGKYRKVVKEISENLGKKIKFKLSGEQGSLCRDSLNILQEAMVHLIRNAIDHGIEKPDQRVGKGKSETGTIEIVCENQDDHTLTIKVKDDGRGIDTEKVSNKSVALGLIKKEELNKMNYEDKLNLIFLPNFSTKEDVTEISGRGIGMDVVKKSSNLLGAKFEVQTELGQGTTFTMTFDTKTKEVAI